MQAAGRKNALAATAIKASAAASGSAAKATAGRALTTGTPAASLAAYKAVTVTIAHTGTAAFQPSGAPGVSGPAPRFTFTVQPEQWAFALLPGGWSFTVPPDRWIFSMPQD